MSRCFVALCFCALVIPASVVAQGPRSLSIGESLAGELTEMDPTHPMRPAHVDNVKLGLSAGDAVTLTLISDDFDAYLYVYAPDGAYVAEDDDGGGDLNSAVSFVAAADGLYNVQVTSFGTETGAWSLDASPWVVQPWQFATLGVGASHEGSLDETDPTWDDRAGDGLEFVLEAGQSVQLHVGSDAFDARVEVLGPNGESVAFDDDGGGGTDAAVHLEAPVAGTYRAVVTGWQRGARGPWVATLTEAALDERGRDLSAMAEATAATRITVGDRVAGTLDESDPTHPERRAPVDLFAFTVDQTGGYDIAMRSDTVDGWLQLLDAEGRLLGESDDADGHHPIIEAVLAPGDYTLAATAWDAQVGDYALTVLDTSTRLAEPGRLVAGARVESEITAAGPVSPHNGHSAVRYRLDVAAGEVWQVTAASASLDMYLVIRDEAGLEVAYDDDGGGGTNSRVRIAMPVDASLLVEVTTYDGQAGPFVVAATRTSP